MCDVSKGKIALACKNAVSGLKALYIANYDDYGFVVGSTASGHVLTDLGTLDVVYKYELKNTGNTYQQDINSNRDTGTTFYNQVVNFILTKVSKEMEFQIKMLAWGRPQIFLELQSGQILLLGKNNGCEIGGNSAVGGTMDSLNGYTLTATGMEPEPAYYLDSTSITALKALVSIDNIDDN